MFFDLSTLFADEELPRKPQQKRSQLKQQAIFEATADLFAEKGYNQTNTKDIAERAGVSIGTLYFNFKDKRQILLAMLASQVGRYAGLEKVDPASVQSDPTGFFAHQLKLAFPYDRVYYSITDAVRELAAQDRQFNKRLGLLGSAILMRLNDIIDAGREANMIHTSLDAKTTAATVSALIFNLYIVLPNPADVTEKEYWRRFDSSVEIITRSIFRDEFVG